MNITQMPELSVWEKARKILGTKSRGARLLVVGILLISTAEILDIVRGIFGIPSEISYLKMIGYICAFWGAGAYIAGD